ncbi:MAG: leucine-rich repeat domain-containing protein, partial [Anaerovoracaceae bacterium]
DKIFGTAYSLDDIYFEKRGTLVESHDFKARSVETLNALDLYEVKNLETKDVVIPDEIQGYPVHRITKRLFKDRENIETLDLGNTVENIGMGAFRGCTKLKKVVIPESVKVINASAFRACSELEEVVFLGKPIQINKTAFMDCPKLSK